MNRSRGRTPASIVDKLEFSGFEKGLFIDLVEAEHSRSKLDRELAAERVLQKTKGYKQVNLDEFQLVADWYHFAMTCRA